MERGINSTKSLIIYVLREKFPLSLTQLYKEIKQSKKVSYQGVHKAIKELVNDKIVEKLEKMYFLNKEWVKEQTESFSKAYSAYFNIAYNPNQIDERKNIQVFRFTSLKDVLDFILEAYTKGYLNHEGFNKIYVSLRQLPPLIPPSLIQVLKKILKDNEMYIICRADKIADRWAAKFYRSLGVKVKTGVNIPHLNSVCFGDFVLQYYWFYGMDYARKVYAFSDNFKKKSMPSFIKMTTDIFYRKAELYLIINRYPLFVEDIKESIAKEFR